MTDAPCQAITGPHRHKIRVYYEDTDFSGIVYHANTLKFFERGRTEALRTCGVSHTDLLGREAPLVFVVRKMDVAWLVPAKIDDLLEVRTRFVSVRGARMFLDQTLWHLDRQEKLAEATVEAACLSLAGRPRRLPADVLARLAAG
ncbi:MAG: tol-pal system-associated acyl-CoA thioesterase [Pseudomonadota bacterium]